MNLIQKIFEKLTGLDVVRATATAEAQESLVVAREANAIAVEATKMAEQAKEDQRLAKLSPKELATERKEPWSAVLDTHVNKDNLRNGFFELDWNEYFIVQLTGGGYTGATDEAIVDLWFQDLCRNIGAEAGVDMERRGAGYINVNNLGNGKSEIS